MVKKACCSCRGNKSLGLNPHMGWFPTACDSLHGIQYPLLTSINLTSTCTLIACGCTAKAGEKYLDALEVCLLFVSGFARYGQEG